MKKKLLKIFSISIVNLFPYLKERYEIRRIVASKSYSGKLVNRKINLNDIEIDLEDTEQIYLYKDCVREPENLIIYRALAESGTCKNFIDIGANYGHVSLSVLPYYETLTLFEPNPKAYHTLQMMYKGISKVTIINAAIVGEESPKNLILSVPKYSSGSASLGSTPFLSDDSNNFECKGVSLMECISTENLARSYIKIDVEGGEYMIIKDSAPIINRTRCIVGFEALSRSFAADCISLFKDYTFYYSKFDFLEDHGALSRSYTKVVGALIGINSTISLYKIVGNDMSNTPNNFSQIYCIPNEKVDQFEAIMKKMATDISPLDLTKVKAII